VIRSKDPFADLREDGKLDAGRLRLPGFADPAAQSGAVAQSVRMLATQHLACYLN
jgi:hypothetical protein